MAGFVNVIGLGLFSKTIGNVTGLVTKLGADLADGMTEGFLVAQFCSFLLGSILCGILISSRRAGVGTELCAPPSRQSQTSTSENAHTPRPALVWRRRSRAHARQRPDVGRLGGI